MCAKPQLEDGRTEIANELIEALAKLNLSAYESRLLWAIFRKTYGWHKKADTISFTQFEAITDLDRRHVGRGLSRLINRNIIIKSTNGHINEYGIQKDYEQWLPIANLGNTDSANLGNTDSANLGNRVLPKEATKLLPKEATTKAIKQYNKSTIQKQLKKKLPSFDTYKEKLRLKYPEFDVEEEWENCQIWHRDHRKQIRSPSLSLGNWMKTAREIKLKGGQHGAYQGHPKGTRLPTRYTEPPPDPRLEAFARTQLAKGTSQ